MLLLFIVKAFFLFALVFLVTPIIFLGLVSIVGRYFGVVLAPDSLAQQLINKFYHEKKRK